MIVKLRQSLNEPLIFLVFLALTILMTWPWALHLRDGAADIGDSYLNSWILWWDYHQTFRNPLRLFDANIFYPYRYSLAFSEHNYGIALFHFPLYALGFRPLTVNGIATLLGFAFCGYGAFRLTRTVTGSNGAAWVGGVVFAFVPYRFHQMPHVTYVWAGWIPLLLEGLIRYARSPTRSRAAWLGIVFFMNALTCIHWFVLTLVPMALSFALLTSFYRLWRNRDYWLRASVMLAASLLGLLPFLIPYLKVSRVYGLLRGPDETRYFSARLINWLTVDWQNKFWTDLGHSVSTYTTELALFPGFLPPLLVVVALLIVTRKEAGLGGAKSYRRVLIAILEAGFLTALVVALLIVGYGQLRPEWFGVELFSFSNPWSAWLIAAAMLTTRWLLAPPKLFRMLKSASSRFAARSHSSESACLGAIWLLIGFLGSFGLNLFFHRLLFDYVLIFRSVRVPARWAMICFVGLALLAALGAKLIVGSLTRRRLPALACYTLLVVLVMFEQRAAPVQVVRGPVDPDAATLYLKRTPMRGGIVELPSGVGNSNYVYTLRAADHARPLVNGVSGFRPLIVQAVEEMTQSAVVSNRFLDLLEAIPVSYLVVHHSSLTEQNRAGMKEFLRRSAAEGRLRLVWQFADERTSDQIFVVTKTEALPFDPEPKTR